MAHRFIGRKRELKLLNELTLKKTASLVVIRGRRRIGKSRLAEEFSKNTTHYAFSGLPPGEGVTAADQREEFARQLQRELKIPLPRAEDWGDLFWTLSERVKEKQTVVVLDEISWMGSKDPTFLGKLKIAWDLYFKTNPQLILILCGSVSSWIEQNILSSTGFMGRISLDLFLEELPLYECNQFWNAEQENVAAFDKLKILSVTGGVPRYLEEIIPAQSAETNIHRLCFRKEGFLFSEFERIFSDLFTKRSATYKKIVKRLSEGPGGLKEIYQTLNLKKSGVISGYLDDLITCGFIAKDFTWHLKNGTESKLSQFRLKDNYLRFYLKHIDPNKSKIERGTLKLPAQWQSIIGLQFENLVLANRKALQELLEIDPSDILYDNPYFQKKSNTNAGCQIDYMIQTRQASCYLFEIKFHTGKIKLDIIDEIKKKIKALSLPRHTSARAVLIHVNGVEDSVASSGFFSSIIDFHQFLEKP